MPAPAKAPIHAVLVLEADRLYADLLRRQIRSVFPATTVEAVSSTDVASAKLAHRPFDLLVFGVSDGLDGDVLDIVAQATGSGSRLSRVLAVVGRHELRVLTALRGQEAVGAFDSASEEPEQFAFALRCIAEGTRYWSPSILQELKRNAHAPALLRFLTTFEQLVFYAVGDGSDDALAAEMLGISPSTVSTVRRELHRKLGVQHRGQLVRVAAQTGFVRFTPHGVLRPGFASLFASYHARRPRRTDSAPKPGDAPPPDSTIVNAAA